MAIKQIPNLPAVTSVDGTELFESVQYGSSVKMTLDQIATFANGGNTQAQALLDAITTVPGSLLYRGTTEWSSIPSGAAGRVLSTNGPSLPPTWITAAAVSTSLIYVDKSGSDSNSGTSADSPFLTIKRAATIAQPGQTILINPGTYAEQWPITLKRDVSVVGTSLRSVNISPVTGYSGNDIFLVDSGCYLTGMTFIGHQAGAWAVRFNANADNTAIGASGLGAYILKSPYVQNCTSYTAADGSGQGGSLSNGTTGGGMLVDGAACAPNSPIRSMVVDSYTQVNLDGPGCLVTNDAYAQLVSFFGTFCSYHVKAESGGQVNLSNSTTDFGTIGLWATGRSSTPLFYGTSGGASIGANTVNVTGLSPNRLGSSNMPNTGEIFSVGGNYYTVTGAVPISGGYTVTFYPYLTSASTSGSTINFYLRSQISTGGHTMEYVGAGTNYLALPWNGGIPLPVNEIVEELNGRVFFSTTDQLGNFKVGEQFSVNGTTGEVTINTDSFNISGLNQVGPFSRDGGITTVGVALMEVSNNTDLFASTGTHDGNTAPTQYAVYNYLLNNYVPTTRTITAGTGLSGGGSLAANRTISLANTAVTAATYGSSTQIPVFAVNAQGQITGVTNTAIDMSSVAITGGSINGTTIGATTASSVKSTTLQVTSSITEAVYAVTGTTPALNAANGTIQTWTLSGNSTPTSSLTTGQSITLMVSNSSGFSITWPSVTWVNNGGFPPTLSTVVRTVVSLWNVSGTLYGAFVGNGS